MTDGQKLFQRFDFMHSSGRETTGQWQMQTATDGSVDRKYPVLRNCAKPRRKVPQVLQMCLIHVVKSLQKVFLCECETMTQFWRNCPYSRRPLISLAVATVHTASWFAPVFFFFFFFQGDRKQVAFSQSSSVRENDRFKGSPGTLRPTENCVDGMAVRWMSRRTESEVERFDASWPLRASRAIHFPFPKSSIGLLPPAYPPTPPHPRLSCCSGKAVRLSAGSHR